MSASVISSLTFVSQQITVYCGTTILIVGVLGEVLVSIVFLSLRIFRQNSCTFYLTLMSIINIGQLVITLFPHIIIFRFQIDWTETSLFYCKFRLYFTVMSALISSTCLCSATIDQYFASCIYPEWRKWSNNIRLSRYQITLFIIIWFLHGIPYLIFFDQTYSISIRKFTCISTNIIFTRYRTYFAALILFEFLPLGITSFFGIIAYRNVQSLAYRIVPLDRRELDKQLTSIVLVRIFVNSITSITYLIMCANCGSSFYIYICVSERFRRQLIFVLTKFFLNVTGQLNAVPNQVAPQSQ